MLATNQQLLSAVQAHDQNACAMLRQILLNQVIIDKKLDTITATVTGESKVLTAIATAVGKLASNAGGIGNAEAAALTSELKLSADKLAVAVASADAAQHPTSHSHSRVLSMSTGTASTPTGNPTIDALIAQVAANVAVESSALAVINGIAAEITAAVNAALTNGATAAQLAPVTAAVATLQSSAAQLSAAVAANTPAAPPATP